MVPPNAVSKLPPNLSNLFGQYFFTLKVPGDNSCFYHSILFLLSSEYRKHYSKKNTRSQRAMCNDFRNKLCTNLTPATFKQFKGFTTISKMRKNLKDYNHWAGNIEWKYVCDQLKINLFMFRYDYDNIYHGWGFDNYNPRYYTVCIMNFYGTHYDPVIFYKNDIIKTKLDPSTQISKKILEFYVQAKEN